MVNGAIYFIASYSLTASVLHVFDFKDCC